MRSVIGFFLAIYFSNSIAWNALGHRVIAEIAYQHLTPTTKKMCSHYNKAINKVYKSERFINAATWLDTLRYQDVPWFNLFII